MEIKFIKKSKKIQVWTDDIGLFERVRQKFSVRNHSQKFSKFSQERIYAISPTGQFLTGNFFMIMEEFRKLAPNYKYTIHSDVEKMINPIKIEKPNFYFGEKFEERDYQVQCVTLGLLNGRGLFQVPTAGGKSMIIYTIARNLVNKVSGYVLILVPNAQLIIQYCKDMNSYGAEPGVFNTFSHSNPHVGDEKIIISNRQWLEKHWDELPRIGAVIVDEVQQIFEKTNNVSKTIKDLDTNVRFGFTGTLSKDPLHIWNCQGLIGPILYEARPVEFQEKGYISNLEIHCLKLNHREVPIYTGDPRGHSKEESWIENNTSVNQFLVNFCGKLPGNTIMFFKHTEHGNLLRRIATEELQNKSVRFIDGSIEIINRDDIREFMERRNDVLLIGNVGCVSTGINMKNVHNLVFTSGGKSMVQVIQSIGRSLRKLEGKETARLFDIHHNCKYSEDHFDERLNLYKEWYDISNIPIKNIQIR